MSEAQPDYSVRTISSRVRGNPPKSYQSGLISQERMDTFNDWGTNLAGKDGLAAGSVPVAGSAVNGTVQASALSVAPASAVNVKETNMLVSQNFNDANTVVALDHWSWDGDDGNITAGCARVDCDGTQSDLVSNEINVVEGENIEVACQAKWEGLSYTGTNPIVLGVEKYRKSRDPDTGGVTYVDVGGVDVASVEAPSTDADWEEEGELAGTYVVPAGVDQLRFRFRAATTITAGTVKWDEAVFLKLDMIPDAAVPGVGQTVDNIVTNLYGAEGEGFTQNDAAVALASTAATLASVSATVSNIDASGSSGSIAGDDFLYSGELITSGNWGGSYSTTKGNYTADGADAVWTNVGSVSTYEVIAKLDWAGPDDTSASDYQKVQLILRDSFHWKSPFPAYYPALYIFGRVSADWQNYVMLEIRATKAWYLKCSVAGSETTLTSGTLSSSPGAGATISLYCGYSLTTTPLKFTADINGANFCNYTDSGTSVYGASYRRWGFGGRARGCPAGYYYYAPSGGSVYQTAWVCTPPKINQWLAVDQ